MGRSKASASSAPSSGTSSRGVAPKSVVAEIKEIDDRLQALWDEHRAERARIRFGEREEIVRRARAEERLERAA